MKRTMDFQYEEISNTVLIYEPINDEPNVNRISIHEMFEILATLDRNEVEFRFIV